MQNYKLLCISILHTQMSLKSSDNLNTYINSIHPILYATVDWAHVYSTVRSTLHSNNSTVSTSSKSQLTSTHLLMHFMLVDSRLNTCLNVTMATGFNPQGTGRDTGHEIHNKVSVDKGGIKFVDIGTGGEGREGSGDIDYVYIIESVESFQDDSTRFAYSFQSEKKCLAFPLNHSSSDYAHILLSHTSSTQYSTYLSDCFIPKDHTHIPFSHTLLSDWLASEDHIPLIDHAQETTSNGSHIHVCISPPTMYAVDSCASLLIYKEKYTSCVKQSLLDFCIVHL